MLDEKGMVSKLLNELETLRRLANQIEDATRNRIEESGKLLQKILNAIPDQVVLKDQYLVYRFANSAFCRFLGKEQNEVIGKTDYDLFPPKEAEKQRSGDIKVIEIKQPQLQEEEIISAAGKKYLRVAKNPVVDDSGQVIGVLCSVRDITALKQMEEALKQTLNRLQRVVVQAVQGMARVVERRDAYTAGHQFRVADLACAIADELAFSEFEMRGIQMAALVHDIGKVGVPVEILNKPGRLTKTEFELIKTHPRVGYDILKEVEFPWPIARIVLQHHERLDGSGYPLGLKADEICWEAKVLAVADVVEAMASHRPYRPALGIEKALEEIADKKGLLYDSDIVEICLRLFAVEGFRFG
ncbi:MAG: HD-GYP domain-containing protein [Bacillota bacterium]